MSSSTNYISDQFLNADHSIRVYLDHEDQIGLLNVIQDLIQRRICIEVVISENVARIIAKDVFLLNKVFNLRKKGSSIFKSNFTTGLSCFIQIDFTKTFILKTDDSWEMVSDQKESDILNDWFSNIPLDIQEFYSEPDDIKVNFHADDRKFIKNQVSSIHWDVKNADKIEISGIGIVNDKGDQSFQLKGDTILTLYAHKDDVIKIRSIFFEVFDEVKITYSLQFFNPSSKEFVSLQEQDENGIFGVAADQKLKLIWQVEGANKTLIEPFTIEGNSGEHVFTPEGSIEISINSHTHGNTKKKRLIVQTFPQPILEKYEIPVKTEFQFPEKFQFPNWHQKFNDKFNQYPDREDIKSKIHANESRLWDLYQNVEFKKFYETHTLTAMNRHVISRIKTYFEEQPQVRDIIDAIKYHHGEGE